MPADSPSLSFIFVLLSSGNMPLLKLSNSTQIKKYCIITENVQELKAKGKTEFLENNMRIL